MRLERRAVDDERADLDALLDARSALRMLSATRPNSPKANSEKAIVVMLSALSSGARLKREQRLAKRELHQSDLQLRCSRDVGRVEDDLAAIQLERAELGAANELEVVRRHQHRRARRVDLAQQAGRCRAWRARRGCRSARRRAGRTGR